FDGIALGDITTSMTINSPAAMIFAMYLVVAEKQGADWKKLSGTIQNDILKEFIAQKEYIFPPRPSMRIITDIFAFCSKQVPKWKLRFHSQTAGVSLTAQQPYNNVVRTALQALSAVLGGTNSLHTNSLDEALALPTAEAATLALRTQQIIAHESGVANVVDPLGGSYFVEKLTREMEDGALAYFEAIDKMGGMVEAIERGFPQKEIAESAYRFQQAVERKEKVIVGVNDFVQQDAPPIEILYIDESAAEKQLAKLDR